VNVVVMTRNPRGIASRFLQRQNIAVAAVLFDVSAGPGPRARLRKLRRVGPSAIPVGLVLRRLYAQDEQPHLDELDVNVVRVPTLDGPEARAVLAATDIAVSLDNALISEATFAAPAHGTINVHHGAVPDYRGGPPLFWELVDERDAVGFTVHRIDAGIDTGPVLATGEVPIARRATLAETLAATLPALHDASLDALEQVIASGRFEGSPQKVRGRARTTPNLRDYLRVRRLLRNYDQRS
jgi:Formyl transferase